MMEYDTWILFCLAELALCLSPGPAVIYVLSQGVGSGFKSSLAANGGIVFGNTIYFVISATGLGALLLASQSVFLLAKWLGTAYLIWLGLRYLLCKSDHLAIQQTKKLNFLKVFQGGALFQLANPKNIIFFMAILPQFINPNYSVAMQILILGISSIIIETSVLVFYGLLGSKIENWAREKKLDTWLSTFSGGALISVGVSLTFIQQNH